MLIGFIFGGRKGLIFVDNLVVCIEIVSVYIGYVCCLVYVIKDGGDIGVNFIGYIGQIGDFFVYSVYIKVCQWGG